jgi:four helix bundle protein
MIMNLETFEQSKAWQKAQDLLEIVEVGLENTRMFWFRDQMCRAALSISNNIAEGHLRPTKPDRMRYLVIAKGSCNEVRSMLHYAKRRQYLSAEDVAKAMSLTQEVGKLLHSYMTPATQRFGHLPGYTRLLAVMAWGGSLFPG